MAAIKAYSDLQQSKKLAEILPLESADMKQDTDYICQDCIFLFYDMVCNCVCTKNNCRANEYDKACEDLKLKGK